MIQVEILTKSDKDAIDAIAELEKESFADSWSKKAIEDTVEQELSCCAVAREEEEIIGYYICYYALDEWEIARIAVAPKRQRQGIGQKLFEHMFCVCDEKKMSRILLDVRESNISAINFYKKNGFVVDGMRKNFYSVPQKENAILMSKVLQEDFG